MKSVLLIRYSALGDVVLATSLVAPLRAQFPGARIEWLTERAFAPLLEGVVDRVISFSRKEAGSRAAALREVAGRFDLAIDLQNKLSSMRIARAAAPVRRRFVRRTPWQALASLFGHDAVLNAEPTTTLYARAAGLEAAAPTTLVIADAARARAEALLSGAGPWVALAPGAAWETKRWPAERLGQLGARLAQRGYRLVLLGGPMDGPLLDAVRAQCPIEADLSAEALPVLAAALQRCKLLVGNDSGLVHVAQAVGCPPLALFGPTSVVRWGPRAPGRALSLQLPCSPCSNHGSRQCPLGHHDCLRLLDVDRVEAAAVELLR